MEVFLNQQSFQAKKYKDDRIKKNDIDHDKKLVTVSYERIIYRILRQYE